MMMSHRCPHSSYFRESTGTFYQTPFRPAVSQLAAESSSERALAQGHAGLVSRLVGPDAPPVWPKLNMVRRAPT